MSLTENNKQLEASLKTMMAGLEGIVAPMHDMMKNTQATPEEALKFKQEYERLKVSDHLEHLEKMAPEMASLLKGFKFD